MSITPYRDEFDADPETKRVLAVALEMTRISLRLTDDLADGIIANPGQLRPPSRRPEGPLRSNGGPRGVGPVTF